MSAVRIIALNCTYAIKNPLTSKLMMRVRFSSPAPLFFRRTPVPCSLICRRPFGSSPSCSVRTGSLQDVSGYVEIATGEQFDDRERAAHLIEGPVGDLADRV